MVSLNRSPWLVHGIARVLTTGTLAVALAGGRADAQAVAGSDTTVQAVKEASRTATIGSTVVTRREIEAAGWHRMAELFEAATGSSRFSVDGFTFGMAGDRLPAAGISATGAPEWLVFIDGVRVPVAALGLQFMELLPVSLLQVDSARFSGGPALVAGVPAPRGALELFTSRRAKGFHAGVSYTRGDETGDPGPFRYTTLDSPNVEKIGPYASAYAGVAGSRADLELSYRGATFTSSDTNIIRRLPPGVFTERNQYNESNSVALRMRVRERTGEHALSLSLGRQQGLIYVPHYAGEGDLEVGMAAALLSGRTLLGRNRFNYVLSASSMPVEGRSVILAPLDTSTRNAYSAMFTGARTVGHTELSLSAAVAHWRLNLPGIVPATWSERVSVTAARAGRRWSGQFNAGVSHARNDEPTESALLSQRARVTLDLSATTRFRYSPKSTFVLNVAQFEAASATDGSWMNATQLGTRGFETPPVLRRLLLGVEHRGSPLRFTGFMTASQTSRWALRNAGALPGAPGVTTPHSATLLGAHVDAQTDTTLRFLVHVAAAASTPLGGGNFMRRTLRSTTASEARATFAYNLFPGFRTSALVHATSGTEWKTIAGGFAEATPAGRRVDLSAEKWAFARRVRAQVVFRNVLNRAERYHPDGAQWNFRTEVSVEVVTR